MTASMNTNAEAGPPHAAAVLTVDLDALAANYRLLRDRAHPAACAAVVKADGYGLGLSWVAPTLWRAGCRCFFVAQLAEGAALRTLLPDAETVVLNGLMPGGGPLFRTPRTLLRLDNDP